MSTTNSAITQKSGVTSSACGACKSPDKCSNLIGSLTPMLMVLFAFYFLLMRPQQKRDAKRREMINAVKRDDKVVTTCGIIGRVHKIANEKEIVLEVAEGVRMRFLKSAVSEVLPNGFDAGEKEELESTNVSNTSEISGKKPSNRKK